jgi:predicted kinase
MISPIIMLVGKTHTGKTTFGRLLKKRFANIVVLETDTIAIFLREHFAEVARLDDSEHTGKFENVSLKFELFETIFGRALEIDTPLILSNSNMWKEGRKRILEQCKNLGRPTIGIYFDLPLEILKERTVASERDTRVLRTSQHFAGLLQNQSNRMQPPDPGEFDEFYVVRSQNDYDAMVEECAKKLSP